VTTSHSIQWTDISREAAEHLGHILTLGTSAPPAWELPAARYLLEIFEQEGIAAFMLPPGSGGGISGLSPQRPNLVAHIPGSGAEEPVLLLSHLDSVPRSAHSLDFPTVNGANTFGGPGALLGTHLAVAQAMALILLARSGIPLRRTVRYAGTSDGAGGKGTGLATLAKNHLEHITSDIALGWGAFSWIGPECTPISLLSCAEKGALWLKLRSEGSGGRTGVRIGRDPSDHMVKALDRLGELEFPVKPCDSSRALAQSIAAAYPDGHPRKLLLDLSETDNIAGELETINADPSLDSGLKSLLNAAFRTEWTVLKLKASAADGLRPSLAEAVIHFSYPPGEDVEAIARQAMEPLKSDGVYLAEKQNVEPSESELSPEVQVPLLAAMRDVDPNAKLVTGLCPWPTGMAALRHYGTSVFGWEPYASSLSLSETLSTRGGSSEKIETDDFIREIHAIYSLLVRMTQ